MRWWRSVLIGGAVLGLLGMGFTEYNRAAQAAELRSRIAAAEHRQEQLSVIAGEVARHERNAQRLFARLQTAKSLGPEPWRIVGGPPARDEEEVPPGDGDAELSQGIPWRPAAVGWRGLTAALVAEPGLRRIELEGGTLVATYTGTRERLERLGQALLEEGRIRSFRTTQGGKAASLHAVLEPATFVEDEP